MNKENRIKEIMALTFGLNADEIDSAASPETIEGWDSLKHMNLITALEEEFQTEFSDDQVIQMADLQNIINVITWMLSKQA